MVSCKLASIIIMSLLSFFFMFSSEASSSSSSSSLLVQNTALAPQKVNVSVYYDSLCQSCATFIVKNLGGIFNGDLINIVNLHLVPWANASINDKNTFLCQNGPDECELNSLQACVLNAYNDVNKYYALVYCFEFLVIEGRQKKWQSCFSQLELPKEPVLDCYNTANGKQLSRFYIEETARLSPPYALLPWVVVNNHPLRKDYANFITYVCNAYKGTSVPAACNLI